MMKKIQYNFLVFILTSLCFIGCTNKSINEFDGNLSKVNNENRAIGANTLANEYSILENGIFCFKENLMYYYDFKTAKSYVLCAKTNCSHSDESCSAWYSNRESISGGTFYRNKVYYFRYDEADNTYDFVSMDISGENYKIIYSISIADYKKNAWNINTIPNNVYYSGNMVWFEETYTYVTDDESSNFESNILAGINLDTGEYTALTKLTDEEAFYHYEVINEDKVIYSISENSINRLSEEKVYSEWEAGNILREVKKETDVSLAYSNWYDKNNLVEDVYYLYEISLGESKKIEQKPRIVLHNEDGSIKVKVPAYIIDGRYNKDYILTESDYNENVKVYRCNFNSKNKKLILNIKGGGLLSVRSCCNMSMGVVDESYFLYCLYTDMDTAEIYKYDLKTNTSKKLFEDTNRNINFRIYDDNSKSFIGKIGMEDTLYCITKTDYFNGNLDKAKKIYP